MHKLNWAEGCFSAACCWVWERTGYWCSGSWSPTDQNLWTNIGEFLAVAPHWCQRFQYWSRSSIWRTWTEIGALLAQRGPWAPGTNPLLSEPTCHFMLTSSYSTETFRLSKPVQRVQFVPGDQTVNETAEVRIPLEMSETALDVEQTF